MGTLQGTVLRALTLVLVVWLACFALVFQGGVPEWIKSVVSLTAKDDYVHTPLELRLVRDVLTDEECAAVKRAALRKGLKRSTVTGDKKTSSTRTSSTVFLNEEDDPVVRVVQDKVASLQGIPKDRFEDLQVIRYEMGQKYDAHYDPTDELPREFTVILYLNDDFEGGATDFPLARASVKPVKGGAAVFRNMVGDRIVYGSQHMGAPVTRGTKWAATVWVHDAPLG